MEEQLIVAVTAHPELYDSSCPLLQETVELAELTPPL